MQFTIDTDRDSFERARAMVHAAYGVEITGGAEAKDKGNGASVFHGGWNEKKLRKWAQLLRPDAKLIVGYIAKNAPEVDYDDAAAYFTEARGLSAPLDGKSMGGKMSSGGHALNRISGVQAQPITRDHARRRYVIDEKVAEILLDELGDPDDWDWSDEE